ncbi:hypothetical protein FOC4_g10000154 [Fusarium odoratissimum]|uniref:Uncharacterized protein n=3 Tax=Fusarium oxysporum species complex TaxID=171631 RepID=N1S775_FUSC4|nr:uncharacterized protein FOIG_16610 [Fusarium odoratissimum NRRL 54006]EMT74663.1 hypothetical protein FOC4_g10000154 [Fusarium odoratissimum]EXL90122.1 hypothetical protein FOIG_16610 [Fusarium odoratissimum NRRL 54006]TXC10146.1 hypothetical protein FocTR4_00006117 [Fusarium oxysporum f. sp. cubense]
MTGRAVPSQPEFLAEWSTLMAAENGTRILQQLELRGQDYERRIPDPNHLADPPRACRRVPKHASSDWRSSASDISSYLLLLPDTILRLAA